MTQLHPPIPFLEWFYDLELSPHPLKILQVPNAGDTLPPGAARPVSRHLPGEMEDEDAEVSMVSTATGTRGLAAGSAGAAASPSAVSTATVGAPTRSQIPHPKQRIGNKPGGDKSESYENREEGGSGRLGDEEEDSMPLLAGLLGPPGLSVAWAPREVGR
ncbi:unnamed protein product [Durusdinium trenchii]|uniref:Uncharacterized protein n=1 Tax=Durusdinium trenchii TaxID=1381693 RepID=A0ABP0LBP4_9DINO